ncbi:MAG TPA: hypothetical protein VEG44_10860 [Candidatus Acidoferrales bacterium]|nr:hypothetical protein [Candidatus Acidoferrales bacterium]
MSQDKLIDEFDELVKMPHFDYAKPLEFYEELYLEGRLNSSRRIR